MALRKIPGSWSVGNATAQLYRDSEWQEFVVRVFVNGVHQAGADYHCDDKTEAWLTAKAMARQANTVPPVPEVTTVELDPADMLSLFGVLA